MFEKLSPPGIRKIYTYCISLLLVISVSFAFWNVDKLGFSSFDDQIYVSGNTNVITGLNKKNIVWAFSSFYASNWHPLTWMSHMIDAELYGMKPAGHHLTSLLFHIVNTLLLFFLLKIATRSLWKSALVSLLFGIHPVHVESIAWISERKDVLSAFFMFLTLIAYVQFAFKKKAIYYFAAFFSFAFGLMAKPMLVSVPCVMLLMDFWPLNRMKTARPDVLGYESKKPGIIPLLLVMEKIPFVILSGFSCVITFMAQNSGAAVVSFAKLPLGIRLCNAVISYCGYISKIVFPFNLSVFYPYPLSQSIIKLSICLCVLISVTVVFALLHGKFPYLIFGWLWYLVTLVPVIGVIQVGAQAMADRYSYVPSIGIFILCVWILFDYTNKRFYLKLFLIFTMVTIVGIFLYQTRKQVWYWKNDLSLAEHALSVTPNNYRAFELKGNYFLAQENLDSAKENYLKSLSNCNVSMYTRLQIGWILLQQAHYLEAIKYFGEVLDKDSANVMANSNCAAAMSTLKDFPNAHLFYLRALNKNPAYVPALYNLGLDYEEMKEYPSAEYYFSQVLRYKPDHFAAISQLDKCKALESKLRK